MTFIDFEGTQLIDSDESFMRMALNEAKVAYEEGEVPIGAVIVHRGRVIGKGHNLTQRLNDVTAHAEMQAFTAAANYLGGKYLDECTLYVTIEPWIMCGGAAYWTHIGKIVYGAKDEKRGYSHFHDKILHPKTVITHGILQEECADLVKSFFRQKR